ncbi:DUF1656 domain-containing protein [Shewanella mangrovisoli]|uniref:DUF1656 domain-containing protein n=1 Tax=Shewanella mangrovisoli TaxID=2864211 RepID=UPI00370A1F20
MINEVDLFGIYVSPLLICMISAFFLRIFISKLLLKIGAYKLIAQRPIFDAAMFISLTGLIFHVFARMMTAISNVLS